MLDRFGYTAVLAGGFMSIFALIGLLSSLKIGEAMQRQSTPAWLIGACALIGLGAVPILAFPENGWAVLAGRGLEGVAMAILAVAGPTLMTRNAAPRHVPIAAALAATWGPARRSDGGGCRPRRGRGGDRSRCLAVRLVGRPRLRGRHGGLDGLPGAGATVGALPCRRRRAAPRT